MTDDKKPIGLARELKMWVDKCNEALVLADHYRSLLRDSPRHILSEWHRVHPDDGSVGDFPEYGKLVAIAFKDGHTSIGYWNPKTHSWHCLESNDIAWGVTWWGYFEPPRHPEWSKFDGAGAFLRVFNPADESVN